MKEQRPEEVSLEEQAEAFKTLLRGKKDEVQWFNPNNGWQSWPMDLSYVNFAAASKESPIRRKPQPKLRPFKPEEVPVGALARCKTWFPEVRVVILAVNSEGITIADCSTSPRLFRIDFVKLQSLWSYSTDNGKSWCPFEVEE